MQKKIIEELRKLEHSIGKIMFFMSKKQDLSTPPSPLQFKILKFLLEHKNSNICQKDLEKNLNVSKATISDVIKTMETNGTIIRNTSFDDARSKIIVISDKSLKRFNEMKKLENNLEKELIKNINEDDLNVFFRVIENMQNNLNIIKVIKGGRK